MLPRAEAEGLCVLDGAVASALDRLRGAEPGAGAEAATQSP